MPKTLALATKHSVSKLRPLLIDRRTPGASDVEIEILYCGICHSDVHQNKNEWHNTLYPCVTGHEIVGRVTSVGASVTAHEVGDLVGVGCMVDSCGHCNACKEGLENYCENGCTATYNGNQRTPSEENKTYGGYSQTIVVRDKFVLKIPAGMDPASTAPILCAGVTTYSPLVHWKAGPGTRVGIVGFGGLGHTATKIAKAMGCEVTVISRDETKHAAALAAGASDYIAASDKGAMKAHEKTLDLILSTIPTTHDPNPYITLLRREGTYVVVGCLLPLALPLDMSDMILDRKSLGSTLIGGIPQTQEVLEFFAKHHIAPNVKVIGIDDVNDAYEHVDKGDVDFRYVIDISTFEGKEEDTSFFAKVGL